ncbi:MAG: hypothetical protein AAF658_08865 [Myxococcota bacterium]
MDQASTAWWQEHARRFVSVSLATTIACAYGGSPVAPPTSGTSDPFTDAIRDGSARPRALVLRTLWLPEPPENARDLDREVLEQWKASDSLEPLPFSDAVPADCADDVVCLQTLGRSASADKVVVYRVGRLGPTTIVRVVAVDVADAAMEQTVQSVLEDGEGSARDAILQLTQQLAEFYEPPEPWYRRPWVWVAAGAVLVAGTLGILLLSDEDDPDPDFTVTPP